MTIETRGKACGCVHLSKRSIFIGKCMDMKGQFPHYIVERIQRGLWLGRLVALDYFLNAFHQDFFTQVRGF